MSDLITHCQLSDSKDCLTASSKPIFKKISTRNAHIGKGITIRRALPNSERRMIGAWCFFDHFGPLNLKEDGLNIGTHPHIGLQTFTWLLAGKILHRDSIGSEQIIQPGEINLMTAGQGIAHSEESLPNGVLHGVQLWIALPDKVRHCAPEFFHYPELPTYTKKNIVITLLVGEFLNLRAPTKVYSPMVGLDLNVLQNNTINLPLNPQFEHGILVLNGNITLENETIATGTLVYLGCGRETISLQATKDTRAFIIGGEPFKEEVLLWWNFVARSRTEMIKATQDWQNHQRFGDVVGYQGDRLNAPEVPLKNV